jgi:mono/diheme cytochrome c family protein
MHRDLALSLGMLMARLTVFPLLLLSAAALSTVASASDRDEGYHQDYIHGVPAAPSEAWTLANGGRLYDNWMSALDAEAPNTTHPAWPESNTKKKGAVTWRCKSCHGWDYAGKDGAYAKGSYMTGITGIRAWVGRDPAEIAKLLRNETHGYSEAMIPADAMLRLATFVSKGQIDTAAFIAADKSVAGDPARGGAIFQNVCAACHGYDGTALDWGSDEKPTFIGTEAQSNPWEVLHKIRAGHPGVEMPALMAFPLKDAIDVLAHTRTLPTK